VRHFAQQFSKRMNKTIDTISSATMEALSRYHWPGNIRELQNVIERAVITSTGPVLKVDVADLKISKPSSPAEKSSAQGSTNGGLAHSQLEGGPFHSELRGCALRTCHDPIGLFQGFEDLLTFCLFERVAKPAICRSLSRTLFCWR